jgi:anti-anti-sigma regulatory factor
MKKTTTALHAQADAHVIQPTGVLRTVELDELAAGLERLSSCGRVLLDWSGVRHLDYRGLHGLALRVVRLRTMGFTFQSRGLDPYLLALACMALSLDEVEGLFGDLLITEPDHDVEFATVFATGLSEN